MRTDAQHGMNLSPQEMSNRAKARNEDTIKIARVANGYLVTEIATGATFVYKTLGEGITQNGDFDDSVSNHLFRFFDTQARR